MITINIKYKLKRDNNFNTITLLPEDYFLPDEDGIIRFDSVPINDHAIDYLNNIFDSEIQTTIIQITDNEVIQSIDIRETFWNSSKNRVIERIDSKFAVIYNEIIVQSVLQCNPSVTEVIRLIRDNKIGLTPVYHGFITDNDDGSQSEQKVL
jgi:hypothetical protein